MSIVRHYLKMFNDLSKVDRLQLVVSGLIKLSLVGALSYALVQAEWTTAFVAVATLAAALLPWYLARSYRFYIPVGFELIIVLFVYATLFLGEVHGFYTRFWWWDAVLHVGSGMAFGFIGFLILYSLHRNGRFQAHPSLIAFFSFSVALAVGSLWEVFEFGMDTLFGFNMQRSGLRDTMWDIIVNTTGAALAALSGYAFLRYRLQGLGIFRYYLESYFGREKEGSAA